MKTLILNGSPRKKGDTVTLINQMLKYLEGEVKIISAYYDNISPCIDCRSCWMVAGCPINDDMQIIYNGINEFDNVIIASPLYFSDLTGPLISLESRFQTYYAAKRFRNETITKKSKKGILILTGGGDGNQEKAEGSAKMIFRFLSATQVGNIYSFNTDNIPAEQDAKAMALAKEMSTLLNNLNKK